MRRGTGQATIELLVLCGLVAALLLLLGGALATGAAAATARALQRALRPPHPVHDDTWALGSSTWGPLLRRYAPRLVLERDRYGADDEVPVEFTRCRVAACARFGVGRPVMYVHLVRRPGVAYLGYWFYYPDSRTTHLPDGGLAGTGPWWATAPGWRPIGPRPVVYRASGSHANGFAPTGIDLAGDRWNGTLGVVDPVLVPADAAARLRYRFDAAASPPWRKRLWHDPDAAGTGADGTQGREVGAARAWAAAWEGLADLAR